MRNSFIKIVCSLLIIGLNWAGISAVGQTLAYFNDIEDSPNNIYSAAVLDFSLDSALDFEPEVIPNTQNSLRTITVQNDGSLADFEYSVRVENATGTLCNDLMLEDGLSGVAQSLDSFISTTTTFLSKQNWTFTATLPNDDPALENQSCDFTFVFEGKNGFSDIEKIENTIISGQWGAHLVINKVYYNPDAAHQGPSGEEKFEWIELYNSGTQPVNLQDWDICDNDDCMNINPNVDIPALGYALISHANSTWKYWEIDIDGVITIHQLGGTPIAMDNTADMLILKNDNNIIIDQMNWGAPTSTWPNYNSGVGIWHPGVPDAPEGYMLGRVPNGHDTDTVGDWQGLGLPSVTGINVNPLQAEHYGCCGNGNEGVSQGDCLTSWYHAPGVYYSQQLTIGWTATTPNASGDGGLSIDIAYITDNDCSGDISGGDISYAVASGIANSGSYVWTGWISGWDGTLWQDENNDVVPYFYGFTWIKITVTGSENFMLRDSEVSIPMFEPLPPGISFEDLYSIPGSSCNSCSLGGADDSIITGGDSGAGEEATTTEAETADATIDEATTTEEVATTTEPAESPADIQAGEEVATTTETVSTTTDATSDEATTTEEVATTTEPAQSEGIQAGEEATTTEEVVATTTDDVIEEAAEEPEPIIEVIEPAESPADIQAGGEPATTPEDIPVDDTETGDGETE